MLSLGKSLLFLASALAVGASAYGNVAPYARVRKTLARRADFNTTVNDYIKEINTAIFAISVIQAGLATAECNPTYENAFNTLGYDGPYAEAFICNSAQGGTNFPGFTLDQARAGLMIALDGLILALNNPNSPARRLDCDYLDEAFLLDAELNGREIVDIVCYPQNFTSTSTTFSGTATGTGSLTITSTSVSATTTGTNSTTSFNSATTTSTNSTTSLPTSSLTSTNSTTSAPTTSITSTNSTTSGTSHTTTATSSTFSLTGTGTGIGNCLWQVATASSSVLTCITATASTFSPPTGPTPYIF